MDIKRYNLILITLLLLLLIATGCVNQSTEGDVANNLPETTEVNDDIEESKAIEKVKVYTSFYPYYDFASRVGGEGVEVNLVVPHGTDPHSFEPTPRVLAEIEASDIFIYNGLEFEPWVVGVLELLEGSETIIINASDGLDLIKVEDNHNQDDDNDHENEGDYDPHIWLDPHNVMIISENIKNAFVLISEENSGLFEDNYLTYKEKLLALDEAFKKDIEALSNDDKRIIVSHSAFSYLARRYSIEEISVAGTSPHAEPTPTKLAELTKLARRHNIKHIFFEVLANPKTAEVLSKEANLEPLVLYNIEGVTQEQAAAGEDYISLMYKNLDSLKKALVK